MPPILEIPERGRIFMSTYEEFMIILTACSLLVAILNEEFNTILTIALLIVAILNLKNK